VAVRTGSKELVELRIEDENRRIGPGFVPEGIPPLDGVLAHYTEEERTGDLVLHLQSGTPPDVDGAAVAAPAHVLHLVIAVDPEPVGRPPVQRELEPGNLGAGPLIEVLVVPPQEEHVGGEPHGSGRDFSTELESVIERFAPGFRDVVLARRSMTAQGLERYNANDVGGDIAGGMSDLSQLFFRPVAKLDPYATSARDIYLCSSSTPPGGGVHGMCGYWAAQSVLRTWGM
jgi:hypothetical protein